MWASFSLSMVGSVLHVSVASEPCHRLDLSPSALQPSLGPQILYLPSTSPQSWAMPGPP